MLDLDGLLRKYRPFFEERRMSDFNEITVNILSAATLYLSMHHKKKAEDYLEYMRQYIRLLDDFPEFCARELNESRLYNGSCINYIKKEYQRLRKVPYRSIKLIT